MGRKNHPKRYKSIFYSRNKKYWRHPLCPLCVPCGKQLHPNLNEAYTHAVWQGKTNFEIYPCHTGSGFHVTRNAERIKP